MAWSRKKLTYLPLFIKITLNTNSRNISIFNKVKNHSNSTEIFRISPEMDVLFVDFQEISPEMDVLFVDFQEIMV